MAGCASCSPAASAVTMPKVEKGECHLKLDDLLEFSEGQLLVLTLPHRFDAATASKHPAPLQAKPLPRACGLPQACSIAATTGGVWRGLHRLALSAACAAACDQRGAVPSSRAPPAAGRADLHPREDHDRGDRPAARRPMRSAISSRRRKWRGCSAIIPDAIAETMRFAGRIHFSLDQLKYQYPDEPVPPGKTAQRHLEDLTWAGAEEYFRDQH